MDPTFPPFGTDEAVVPGEVLVKLAPEAAREVTEGIPTGPRTRLAADPPQRLGHKALDRVLGGLKVESIVRLHGPVPTFAAAEDRVGADELGATLRLSIGETDTAKAVAQLARAAGVVEASPNYYRYATVVPNDPMFSLQWGLTKIRCPEAWDRVKGDPSTVVAVVDTGIDLDHPDLAGLLLAGNDLVDLTGVAPRPGWHFDGDFLTRDNNPQDDVGHGTHVAGTIAALTNNATGVAGVTWFCRLLPVRVLARMVEDAPPNRVTGVGTAADIAAGIRWATDNGAHIISMSLGGGSDTFAERDAIAYAQAHNVLCVAAMGNDASSAPSFPAAYRDVVAVGAIDQAEHRAAFSNTGPHIDVAAPGVGIRSTVWDNSYATMDGTSMATPHVSGVAALVRSCKSSLSAAEIAQILRDTARALRDNPGDPVPNEQYGFGLVDARAAIDRACPPPTLKFVDDPTLKPRDDITVKFQDDVTRKFQDDPTLKAQDDITVKLQDDITRKAQDDPTLKAQDDVTRKLQDDITLKAQDDPGTLKAVDDPGTLKAVDDPGTLKAVDDPGTLKAVDDAGTTPVTDPIGPDPGGGDPAPFALAIPHHSMAWAATQPDALLAMIGEYEQALAGGQATEQMQAEYEALVAEYRRLIGGGS